MSYLRPGLADNLTNEAELTIFISTSNPFFIHVHNI